MSAVGHGVNIDFNLCSHFHPITTVIISLPLEISQSIRVPLKYDIIESHTKDPMLLNGKPPRICSNYSAKKKKKRQRQRKGGRGKDGNVHDRTEANCRGEDKYSNDIPCVLKVDCSATNHRVSFSLVWVELGRMKQASQTIKKEKIPLA